MIELRHLTKVYREGISPLKDVSVTVNDGDVIAVIGPSGAGKSTLLRCLNLLETPTGGQILLDGEEITAPGYDVRAARRRMGMVFQSFNLFGHLTVIENVMLAPTDLLGVSRQAAYDKGIRLLRQVGMADRALSYPDELSGGQKQRVAIARATVTRPKILLADEPTGALDSETGKAVLKLFYRINRTEGTTVVIVTHDPRIGSITNRCIHILDGSIKSDLRRHA